MEEEEARPDNKQYRHDFFQIQTIRIRKGQELESILLYVNKVLLLQTSSKTALCFPRRCTNLASPIRQSAEIFTR